MDAAILLLSDYRGNGYKLERVTKMAKCDNK